MGKTAKRPTMVTDERGVQHRFNAGDEVPDELVARIDNPAVWEDPEPTTAGPDPSELNGTATVSTMPSPSLAVQDAPYATPPEHEGVTNQAGTGLEGEDETSESSDDGGSSDEPAPAGVKPSSGDLDGMTAKELAEVAAKLDVSVPSGASKAQIRAIIDSAPDRPAAEGD